MLVSDARLTVDIEPVWVGAAAWTELTRKYTLETAAPMYWRGDIPAEQP